MKLLCHLQSLSDSLIAGLLTHPYNYLKGYLFLDESFPAGKAIECIDEMSNGLKKRRKKLQLQFTVKF